ncbi:MAG: hypothetical protein Q9219_002263 [cf. Caloplaca sp. 3 TL-2023]
MTTIILPAPRIGLRHTEIAVQEGCIEGHAVWGQQGPMVEHIDNRGYVNSPGYPEYSRDIGRSFILKGRVYYLFGDTFCNDAGVSSNTYQLVPDRTKPTHAYYLSHGKDGYILPLIPQRDDEQAILNSPGHEEDRFAFWCFGGVVENNSGLGWMWYQSHLVPPSGLTVLQGVGIARVSSNASTCSGELSCARMPGLLFDREEIQFGSFSVLSVDNMVYMWGQLGADVYLACVAQKFCHQRRRYRYWNGHEYVEQIEQAVPVLRGYQQGQIFQSDLFGPELPWLFVGCTNRADSKVMLGVAAAVEGPWDVRPIFTAQGIKQPQAFRYCVYAHPWFAEKSRDRLLISWCDQWPGGVIAAECRFKTNPSSYWVTLNLENCNGNVTSKPPVVEIADRDVSGRIAYAAEQKAKEISRASSLLHFDEIYEPHRLRLYSIDEYTTNRALEQITYHLRMANKHWAVEEEARLGVQQPRGNGLWKRMAGLLHRRRRETGGTE